MIGRWVAGWLSLVLVPLLAAAVVGADLAVAQQTWIVDSMMRTGAHHADLQPAVDAAVSGDVIVVRYTSSSLASAYLAPTIQNKALRIAGEGTARPVVIGGWQIHGVTGSTVIRNLDLVGRSALIDPNFMPRPLFLNCTGCSGPILIEDAVWNQWPSNHDLGGFFDCRLVILNRCSIDLYFYPVQVIRSTLMMSATRVQSSTLQHTWGSPALLCVRSDVTLSNSTVIGSSVTSLNYPNECRPAVYTCASTIRLVGTCVLESGRDPIGIPCRAVMNSECLGYGAQGGPSTIVFDATMTQALGGYSSEPGLIYVNRPQTGISHTLTTTALQVDQNTHSGALAALAVGPVTTTPWTYYVGPVFVSPTGGFECFDFAPSTGLHRWTLPLPPGLPPGTHACVQAFEVLQDGSFLTSNAAIAGLW